MGNLQAICCRRGGRVSNSNTAVPLRQVPENLLLLTIILFERPLLFGRFGNEAAECAASKNSVCVGRNEAACIHIFEAVCQAGKPMAGISASKGVRRFPAEQAGKNGKNLQGAARTIRRQGFCVNFFSGNRAAFYVCKMRI